MNNREVINRLRDDMAKIELPPIPEKVLQAVREQKKKYLEYKEQLERINRQKRNTAGKWVFAAMITALVVSVPIIVVVSNNKATNNMISDNSSVSDQSLSANSKESITAEPGTLEHIKIINLYGTVSLSKRSEAELETMLQIYSKENSVYEDDKYLYNFNSDGKLTEILKTDLDEDIQGEPVTQQEISEKAEAVLKEYFHDFADGKYEIYIQENQNCYPAWDIDCILKNSSIMNQKIHITFDKYGTIQKAYYITTSDNHERITQSDAIQIALNELRSGKYNILDFNEEDISIIVKSVVIDGTENYSVYIDNIPYDIFDNDIYYAFFEFGIDSSSGKLILLDSTINFYN